LLFPAAVGDEGAVAMEEARSDRTVGRCCQLAQAVALRVHGLGIRGSVGVDDLVVVL
jgi:hypothetical protein